MVNQKTSENLGLNIEWLQRIGVRRKIMKYFSRVKRNLGKEKKKMKKNVK